MVVAVIPLPSIFKIICPVVSLFYFFKLNRVRKLQSKYIKFRIKII